MKVEDLKPGMKLRVTWVDDEEEEGEFVMIERGYVVINSSGSIHACLPAHLKKIEVLNDDTDFIP